MSLGLFVSGYITYFVRERIGREWQEAYPPIFGMYAIIGLIKVCVTLFLTERCEANYTTPQGTGRDETETTAPLLNNSDRRRSYNKGPEVASRIHRIRSSVTAKLSPESRKILVRLCILFAINSFASGMLPVTIMSWYVSRWGVSVATSNRPRHSTHNNSAVSHRLKCTLILTWVSHSAGSSCPESGTTCQRSG